MGIDLMIEDDRWSALDLAGLADRAAQATLAHRGLEAAECEISLLACDDARIAVLNAEFRGKPAATNVLSWPSEDLAAESDGDDPVPARPDMMGEMSLGDIAIAWETCAREAKELNKTTENHVTHLIVHGILHLLGYDHIRDADATLMERYEVEILGNLGVDDPYKIIDGA